MSWKPTVGPSENGIGIIEFKLLVEVGKVDRLMDVRGEL
jgi:hypothetical protein